MGEPDERLTNKEWDAPGADLQLLLPVASKLFDPARPGHIGLILKTVGSRSEFAAYLEGEKVARPVRLIIPDETAIQLAADLVKAVQKTATGKA